MNNETKYKNYKLRKVLRYIVIFTSILTVVLSILALIKKISLIYALLSFIVLTILKRYRNSLKL